jgi:hypothetical protein
MPHSLDVSDGDSRKASRSVVSRAASSGFVGIVEFRHDLIMKCKRSDGEPTPLTLGQALAAQVRIIVWCKSCEHRP